MNETWRKTAARFDALKSRERVLVFATGVVVIGWLVFTFAIDPELTRHKRLSADLLRQQTTLAQLQVQSAELMRSLAQDPDAAGRARIDALKAQRAQFDTDLRGIQQGLVPPRRMARVLEDLLNRDSPVRLLKLRTLPVVALTDPAGGAAGKAAASPSAQTKNLVYKHGMELTLEGSYFDLLKYQTRLEKLPWRMFFARTSVDATGYPRVLMNITLYTISLEEAWLVV